MKEIITVTDNNTFKFNLNHKSKCNCCVQTIFPSLKLVIAGDLSFFVTSTGRDGHSHCRCPYCDLSMAEWKDHSNIATPMTLELLTQSATAHHNSPKFDTKVIVMPPLLNIELSMYIVPLLHLMIGLVNKVWSSLCLFLDEYIENIRKVEATCKQEVIQCTAILEKIAEEIEIHTINKIEASFDMASDIDLALIYSHSCEELQQLCNKKKMYNQLLKDAKCKIEN